MIGKQDILDRAAEWRLRPDIVEKDYVLGWLLASLMSSDLRDQWVFKGGTCIKKCFFETYRFSEDLDFSLRQEASYTKAEIEEALGKVTRAAYEASGIEFPEDRIVVQQQENLQGQPTFRCRISYRGPLAIPTYPRVLIDLTRHEPILDNPSERSISHPYPDAFPDGLNVLTYSFDELLAEKTRALYDRARPRDLYDVVYLLENHPNAFNFPRTRALLRKKCQVKELPFPAKSQLVQRILESEELRSEWENMLGHQLPILPDLDMYLKKLPTLLQWIEEPAAVLPEAKLAVAPIPASSVSFVPAGIRYWGGGLPLETIRFAGSNRLMIEFDYDRKHRLVEPYSLRRAATTGNILLYGWEQEADHMKAYNVAKMSNVRTTSVSFAPRYRVELSSAGSLSIPTTTPTPRRASRPGTWRRTSLGGSRHRTYGPTYVYECPYCQRRFRHSRNNSKLGRHKTKDGLDCPGRRGLWVDTGWD